MLQSDFTIINTANNIFVKSIQAFVISSFGLFRCSFSLFLFTYDRKKRRKYIIFLILRFCPWRHHKAHLYCFHGSCEGAASVWAPLSCVLAQCQRRKDISNDLRGPSHQFSRHVKPFPKQFKVHHSTVRKIIHKCKHSKSWTNASQELHFRLYRPQIAC